MKLLLTFLGLCFCNIIFGQIKIGDNPQNIDANSVLELESTNRALVISRMPDVQMNALTPLPGALVFNTDTGCVHFFDGSIWLNLCETFGLSFTADPIVNPASTIVITQTDDNYNFEVSEIRGTNIVDFSISGIDIQNNSLTAEKLAPDSVGNEELRDNSVTDAEIDYNLVTLNDFFNDAGFITTANIVSTDAGNSVVAGSDNGAFYDNTPLQNDIAQNATDIASNATNIASNTVDIANNTNAINTISLVDTGNGTYTFTDAAGIPTNILDTSVSTLTDQGDGTYTYTDETGATQIIDTNASSNPYDNSITGLTATNVQDAIDQISTATGTVSLVDNGDGTYTFTDAVGNNIIIADTSISTLLDNGDGTYTYTDESGNTTVISDTSISTLVDNGDGTYTYTDETGTVQLIDINETQDLSQVLALGTDANANNINNLSDPLLPQDAATKFYVDQEIANVVASGSGDPNDELQDLDLTGTTLTLTLDPTPVPIDLDATFATDVELAALPIDDADADPTNEYNTGISFDGANLTITDAGGDQTVDISAAGTDDQTISTSGAAGNITIEDGNTININVDDADADANNEIQDLQFAANVITLTGDPTPTNIDLSGYDTNAGDDFDGNWGSLAGVPAGFADNTDDVNDADADATNEIQDLQFAANVITLTGDPTPTNIDLSGYDTNAGDDFDGNWGSLAGVPAGFADNTDDVNDADADATNEIQDLQFAANIITLTGDPTPTNIDLSGYDTNAGDDFDGNWGSLAGVPAGFADNIDDVNDADADATNEIQDASQVNLNPAVDVDKDGINETTVQQAIEDISTSYVVALGKVEGTTGNALKINGATVVRNSIGNYTITFSAARSDSNYIISVDLLDNDLVNPATINVVAQSTTQFTVQILTVTTQTLADKDWYFNVMDF